MPRHICAIGRVGQGLPLPKAGGTSRASKASGSTLTPAREHRAWWIRPSVTTIRCGRAAITEPALSSGLRLDVAKSAPMNLVWSAATACVLMLGVPVVHAQENTLIEPDAKVVRLAGDFGFTEGPAADAEGNVYFTDIPNERILKWSPQDGVTIFREQSGRANGLRFDQDGNLIVCEMGNRRITAIDMRGRVTVLADRFEDNRFNSPNDLWVDPQGGIYFTDPRYGATDNLEITGYHVYYITPDRQMVRRVISDLTRPNGIIGTLDGSRLYVADDGAGSTYVYTPQPDGSLTNKRLFTSQGADGMTMDERGNLYLTGQDITIYNPDGKQIGSIGVSDAPANLTFGGPGGRLLFIAARMSLYAVRMTVTGQ